MNATCSHRCIDTCPKFKHACGLPDARRSRAIRIRAGTPPAFKRRCGCGHQGRERWRGVLSRTRRRKRETRLDVGVALEGPNAVAVKSELLGEREVRESLTEIQGSGPFTGASGHRPGPVVHRRFHRAVDEGQPGGADTKGTTVGPATTNGPSADEHSSEAASADAS